MDKKWLPTPEERVEICKRHELNSGEMRDELIKFTAKKIHDEGYKPCPHRFHYKRECPVCWQELLKEIEEG